MRWTVGKLEQLRTMYRAALTYQEIAENMGVTLNTIKGKINNTGMCKDRDNLGARCKASYERRYGM